MSKYIDAEKLIAYLKKTMESYKSQMVDPTKYPIDHIDLMAFLAREYQAIIANVESLQQEQTELPPIGYAETYYQKGLHDGFIKGLTETIKGLEEIEKRKAEPHLVIKEQEQPEVDLEKEIVSICETYGITKNFDAELGPPYIKNITHHFYELGLNAKKEE